jgi:hypothetical protein
MPLPEIVEPPAHGLRQGLMFMSTAKEDDQKYVSIQPFGRKRNLR